MRPMDQPHTTPTRVALNRVRRYPVEMPDVFWPRKDVLPLSQDLTIDYKKEPELQWNQPHSRLSGTNPTAD